MERKHYQPPIGMLHFDVTTLAMDLNKAETLESGENLFAWKYWQFHTVSSTSS